MTEAHKKVLNSTGCGVRIEATDQTLPAAYCRHDGPRCSWCQVKRDVCDELTAALKDTAILDTLEREVDTPFRRHFRNMCKGAGVEIKCRP